MWVNELIAPLGWIGAAVIGLGIWRYQLISKRRYEVAEEALTAANSAAKALHRIRRTEAEIAAWPENPDQIRPHPSHEIHGRLQMASDAFDRLEKSRNSIEMHFGSDAASPFTELRRMYSELHAAHVGLFYRGIANKTSTPAEHDVQWEEWQKSLFQQAEGDPFTKRIDDASEAIVARFGRHLRPTILRLFLPSLR